MGRDSTTPTCMPRRRPGRERRRVRPPHALGCHGLGPHILFPPIGTPLLSGRDSVRPRATSPARRRWSPSGYDADGGIVASSPAPPTPLGRRLFWNVTDTRVSLEVVAVARGTRRGNRTAPPVSRSPSCTSISRPFPTSPRFEELGTSASLRLLADLCRPGSAGRWSAAGDRRGGAPALDDQRGPRARWSARHARGRADGRDAPGRVRESRRRPGLSRPLRRDCLSSGPAHRRIGIRWARRQPPRRAARDARAGARLRMPPASPSACRSRAEYSRLAGACFRAGRGATRTCYAGAAALMPALGLLAAYLPARRAWILWYALRHE